MHNTQKLTYLQNDITPHGFAKPSASALDATAVLCSTVASDTVSPALSEDSETAASSPAASDDTARFKTLEPTTPQGLLAQALRRLTQWAHMQGWSKWATQRLTPTQLKILGMLATRAQGLSLTEVARELGASASTTCDSMKALKHKGFLTQRRDPEDARQHTLLLTPKGHSIASEAVTSDPLLEAFAGLTAVEQEVLQVLWMKMIHELENSGALPASRTCVRCQFFRPFFAPSSGTPHMCLKVQQALAASTVRLDCDMFEAASAAEQDALWEAFVGGTAQNRQIDAACPHQQTHAVAAAGQDTLA